MAGSVVKQPQISHAPDLLASGSLFFNGFNEGTVCLNNYPKGACLSACFARRFSRLGNVNERSMRNRIGIYTKNISGWSYSLQVVKSIKNRPRLMISAFSTNSLVILPELGKIRGADFIINTSLGWPNDFLRYSRFFEFWL